MMILRILLALLILPLGVGAADFELPDAPAGQILDGGDWLGNDEKLQLESELTRLRETHQVDVFVVIWSEAIENEIDLQDLAGRLGETWNRGELWAVVLQQPESLAHPIVAWGGLLLESAGKADVEEALDHAVSRGLKEWSERNRVSGVALNLGEELVFHRHRSLAAREKQSQQQAAADAVARQLARTKIIRISLIGLAILIAAALAVFAWILLRARRPPTHQFPQTRWRRRLGASWSGGSKLITSFTPPDSE